MKNRNNITQKEFMNFKIYLFSFVLLISCVDNNDKNKGRPKELQRTNNYINTTTGSSIYDTNHRKYEGENEEEISPDNDKNTINKSEEGYPETIQKYMIHIEIKHLKSKLENDKIDSDTISREVNTIVTRYNDELRKNSITKESRNKIASDMVDLLLLLSIKHKKLILKENIRNEIKKIFSKLLRIEISTMEGSSSNKAELKFTGSWNIREDIKKKFLELFQNCDFSNLLKLTKTNDMSIYYYNITEKELNEKAEPIKLWRA